MAKKINEITGMPNVSSTLDGWVHPIKLAKIERKIVDGISKPTKVYYDAQGTIQPLSPEQIRLKDEGQRAWSWWQIHVKIGNVELIPDDRIEYNGLDLKVMAKRNYNLNGYVEYHAIEDYKR